MAEHVVAVVHDYLTQRGGAERVVLSLLKAFPDAPVYTSVYNPNTTFPQFRHHDVRVLWTDHLTFLRRRHRAGLMLYPFAFSSSTVDAEVTICSSSGFAHAVKSTGPKIVYCYTPARWLYDEADSYLVGWPRAVRRAARMVAVPLRWWDRRAIHSADSVLTTSTAVRKRIACTYGLDAAIVSPPIQIEAGSDQRPVPGVEPGFLLSVGRLLSYKNIDVLASAMKRLEHHRLVIVGTGPERAGLETMAGPNVMFVGEVDDASLRWLYAHSAGLVSASFEDYGLTPIEAAAYGKPSAVLRCGGFLDTVDEGRTGVFFDLPEAQAVADAIARLMEATWDSAEIASHAQGFGEENFILRIREVAKACTAGSVENSDVAGTSETPSEDLP